MEEKNKGVISLITGAIVFGFIMVVPMDGRTIFLNIFIALLLANLTREGVFHE